MTEPYWSNNMDDRRYGGRTAEIELHQSGGWKPRLPTTLSTIATLQMSRNAAERGKSGAMTDKVVDVSNISQTKERDLQVDSRKDDVAASFLAE